jgi:hypothetical protein
MKDNDQAVVTSKNSLTSASGVPIQFAGTYKECKVWMNEQSVNLGPMVNILYHIKAA